MRNFLKKGEQKIRNRTTMRVHYLTDSDRLRAMLPDELAIVEEAPGLSRVVLEWARSDGDGLGSYTQCLQVSAFCCDCCQLTICVFFFQNVK